MFFNIKIIVYERKLFLFGIIGLVEICLNWGEC